MMELSKNDLTNKFNDLKAIDFFADEVLNLDCSSGASHDYLIQIY